MMVWNQIGVLEVKISKTIEKSYCYWPILCPIFDFQFLKLKFPGPTFYSFDQISDPQPISQSTMDGKWHVWGAGSLIRVEGSSQQKS